MTDGAQFDAFADDLLSERSGRPLVIIGASKIDGLLSDILKAFLLPKRAKSKEDDELLEGDRPLATFSAKIKVCYRLALIDDTLCQALEKLRSMRNLSAHAVAFDLSKSPLREHFSDFRKNMMTRKSFDLTKQRYFQSATLNGIEELQCLLLTVCVLLEAVREKTVTTAGSSETLWISSR